MVAKSHPIEKVLVETDSHIACLLAYRKCSRNHPLKTMLADCQVLLNQCGGGNESYEERMQQLC